MKRWLRGVALVAAAVLLLTGGFRVVRGLAFFQVRRLELVGGRYLTPLAMARALAIPPGTSVFADLGPWERKARAMPGVRRATVSRRLPGTIRVAIEEAEPVALAERKGRLVLLDASGQVLPFDPTQPAADLPVAPVDARVTGLLARLRDADPDLFARVEQGARVRDDVVLDLGAGRVWFRAGASAPEFRDLAIVLDHLTRRGTAWRELDARVSARVFVRGGRA
jgi:hypothetical protein